MSRRYPTTSRDMVVNMVSWGSTIRGGYYHNLFVFVGFPYVSSLFPYFVVVAPSISLLSTHIPSLQNLSALWIVLLQLCACVWSITQLWCFTFLQFLLSFCLVSSSYCFHHSPYCFLYLSTCVDATVIVLIVFSYLNTVELITINTPVCYRVTSEQKSASSPNSSCDPHTSTSSKLILCQPNTPYSQ